MAAGGGAGADLVRRALSRVLAVFAGLVLVGSTLWWWDLTGPVPVLQSIYPVVPAAALVALLCTWAARAWRPMGVMALALSICGAALIPTVLPRQEGLAGDDAGGPTLRVVAVNALYGQVDLSALAREIDARSVDLLILTEAGPQFTPSVREGAIGERLPYDSGATMGGSAGTLILSRYPMRVIDRDDTDPDSPQQPIVEVTVGGRRVVVRGVHPPSPSSREKLPEWRSDLAKLERWQQQSDSPLIMAGDFNSAWPHPGFRAVTRGMTDAMQATGQAWLPTWPASGPIPPFTQIDHVLARGARVLDAGVVPLPGTDHHGVYASVQVP